ncbi:MAG: Rid family hydrolase [Ilumatobacteraceae bacterium]
MEKHIVKTADAPNSLLYSQGVRVGGFIFVSGMTGTDVATAQLAGSTIQAQTKQALRNCLAIVEAGGGTLTDIVQVSVLLANPDDFVGMNEAYATVFTTDPPTRAVAKLGVELPGVLVSIALTAHVDR